MNRCLGITKTNNRCRAKIKDNKLFCCKNHESINKELIDGCCFMCMEKVEKTNDIIFFKCKHAFHRECYFELIKYSNYDSSICMICRNPVLINTMNEKIFKKVDTTKLDDIIIILNNYSYGYSSAGITGSSGSSGNTGPQYSGNTGPQYSGNTGPQNTGPQYYGNTGPQNTGPQYSGITGSFTNYEYPI